MTRTINKGRAAVVGGVAVATLASGTLLAMAATPPPAHQNATVGLMQVGPIDEANGFPLWYKDTSGTRLELCTDPNDAYCIMGDLPNPTAPVSFPGNFPDEAFWASAEASIDAGGGDTALLVTAVEAAFASADGLPAAGQQVSFGRIRIRASGVVDGATYRVTHPFGTDQVVAETGAVKGLNVTEDIGSLVPDGVFDQTLGARTGPFLRWTDGAPAGYLGDPTVEHAVTGSPYGTNFFRIEGPAGSFTGSTQLCIDPALGSSSTATDDCIESRMFNVQGKLATRAGVQVTKAYYSTAGTGHHIDLFATSEPGQRIVVSGTGVPVTTMRDSGTDGRYYARVYAEGPPPSDLAVTDVTDTPDTVDHVASSQFGDKVHVTSAVYDNDERTLKVTGQSGDTTATLRLLGYTATATPGSSGGGTWTVSGVVVPPAEVTMVSNRGGVDTEDVVITGSPDPAAQVVATITADTNRVQTGQPVTLDATASVGTITGYAWSVSPTSGVTLSGTGVGRTFNATVPGTYVVTLTVTGPGAGNTATDRWTITVDDPSAPPVASAGPDQLNVVPTSTITLDGTASRFATSYAWTQTGGAAVALANATTANPTFVAPATTTPATLTFSLTIRDVNGTAANDTVVVTTDPDNLAVDAAQYKRGSLEWRVRGTAQYCSANNLVSVWWNKPGTAPVLLGTTTPALDLGVCGFDFRLKNTPAAMRATAAGTVTVRSALGGEVVGRAFTLL